MVALMDSPPDVTGPINIGNPNEFTIRALAELVIEITGSKSQIIYKPLPQDDPIRRQPNIHRAKALLNWQPNVELKEGLGKTIAYFEHLMGTNDPVASLKSAMAVNPL
jgi:UDP-glucuronate decarboxylase